MTTPVVVALDELPGALSALEAVQYVGGVLLAPAAAEQLVVTALYAADNATRAAAFADAADVLHDYAEAFSNEAFAAAAELLDNISMIMRAREPRP